MLKYLLFITMLTSGLFISQNSNVGINTIDPNNKAALEVNSKLGVLLPRLTTIQRDAIVVSPDIDGMLIYNVDEKCFNFYSASQGLWDKMCGSFAPKTEDLKTKN